MKKKAKNDLKEVDKEKLQFLLSQNITNSKVDLELIKVVHYNISTYSYDGLKLYSAKDIEPILDALDTWMDKKGLLLEQLKDKLKEK